MYSFLPHASDKIEAMTKYFITNAIPYVNAKPHIGHALEFIQSDTIARYHRSLNEEVVLLCGGDENALKNVQAAEAAGKPIKEFIDYNAGLFAELAKRLNIQFDIWQKGSAENHYTSSQKLWELCDKNGYIYKKEYTGLYCVGCELFYEPEELNDKKECFEHPGKKLEEVSEENYFFKLSAFQENLEKIIAEDQITIIPQNRKHEVLAFLKQGLKDISISRSNKRAKNWGVPVPGDDSQRIYVWFDALNIYHSGIGFGSTEQNEIERFKKLSPVDLHVIGKGILRFHAIYWPAFLLAAGVALPKSIFVHEYITVNGQKMSKTLGNVIDPNELLDKYGTDALRYYCLAKISPFSDGDFSEDKLKEVYNADLANGLGNLVARVAKLAEKINLQVKETPEELDVDVKTKLDEFKLNEAIAIIWSYVSSLDKEINEKQPWKLPDEELAVVLEDFVNRIRIIAYNLQPFLPEASEKILQQFSGDIKVSQPLFPRIV